MAVMFILKNHGSIYLFLIGVTYAAFGALMSTPLWNALDFHILADANELSRAPATMLGHLGFYFSQPLLQLAFLLEYRFFGLNPAGYIGVNLFVHATNAFLLYMLVNMLFPRHKIALLAATLFAFTVGSYGKVLMNIAQLETLLLANFHILVLYFFIRNDFRHEGRLSSPYFFLGLALFVATGLTKAASFSLLGCLLAYKLFFRRERSLRSLLNINLLIFILVAILFYVAQNRWGFQHPTVVDAPSDPLRFTLLSVKNVFRYLNLMFFPLQRSPLLEESPFWVIWIYEARMVIRFFLTLSILSFSFFGFVFGNRAVRFFIAWTFITLLPFTAVAENTSWLNLNHLYLTSLGFCVILAAGTRGTQRLLARRRWRRYIPYVVPLYFVVLVLVLTYKLDDRHRGIAERPHIQQLHEELIRRCAN